MDKQTLPEEDEWASVFNSMFSDEEEDTGSEASEETEEIEEIEEIEETESAQAEGTEEGADSEEEDSEEEDDLSNAEEDPDAQLDDAETDDTEEEGSDGTEEKSEAKTAVEAVLERIRAVDPSVQSFNDLEDVGLFAVLLDRGIEPEEALRISSPKLRAKSVADLKAKSKRHMKATATDARDDAIPMSVINQFRAARPEMSKKEAIALYRRVNGK